jgi:hypothetical protein
MAKAIDNILLYGLQGSIGNQITIHKTREGYEVRKKSQGPTTEPTEAQLEVRENFKRARLYAEAILEDPNAREAYEAMAAKKKTTALRLAMRDLLKKPTIKMVDVSSYDGNAGGSILIAADDDFGVAEVKVTVLDFSGAVVEEGLAEYLPLDLRWIFTSKTTATLVPDRVEVKVKDRPGNEVVQEQSLK